MSLLVNKEVSGCLSVLARAAARPGLLGAASTAGPAAAVVPSWSQVRFRKIMVKRPHQPDWFRKKLLGVSKPYWDDEVPIENEPLQCEYVAEQNEKEVWLNHINQLEKFYVEELKDLFTNSQMIGFYHTNPIARCNFRKAWQNGRRMNMELVRYNFRVGKAALRDTEYENCLHFFFNCYTQDYEQPMTFCPEVKPKQLITMEKKTPEFHLLGAVMYGRILSRKQVIELNDIPDLDQQRAQLVALLNANQSKLTSLLQSNQQQLSTNLDQYIKDQNK